MKNTEIIYSGLGFPIIETLPHDGLCKVCGKKITEGVKDKDILSGSFTNWSELKEIESNFICKECSSCIKTTELRQASFVGDLNKLHILKKNDLEEYLFNLEKYITGEFVVGITTSFKKHNSFRCRVNSNPKRFYIRQEDREYLFDSEQLKLLFEKLNDSYLQFNKEELLTGQYNIMGIEQFGLQRFQEYEEIFKKHRGSSQYNLLIYMMNSEKRQVYMETKIKVQKEEKVRLKELEKEKLKEEKGKCQKKQIIQPVEKIQEMQLSLL